MQNDELKPCPFCGGKAGVEAYGDSAFSYLIDGWVSVKCIECEAESQPHYVGFVSKEESEAIVQKSITEWNRRVGC